MHAFLGLADRPLHDQRGPYRAFSVVLMGDRRAEQGDDGVAHDLVDPPAELGHHRHQPLEAAIDEVLHVFGVARLAQRREADDVGENHRDDAPLVAARGEYLATGGAEAGPVRH